jgi:hypothetical protein
MTVHDPSFDHARHDQLLIAALAAGDLAAADRTRAQAQLEHCSACAELARDLRAIATSTSPENLPIRPRPRAFILEPADAARLRPAGLRGVLRRLAGPGFTFTRPLAAGLTTLGIAVLVVAALPATLPLAGSPAGAPSGPQEEARDQDTSSEYSTNGGPPAPSAAAGRVDELPSASPMPGSAGQEVIGGPAAAPGSRGAPGASDGATVDRLTQTESESGVEGVAMTPGPSLLVIAGWTLVAVGLALFALRWAGRRLA